MHAWCAGEVSELQSKLAAADEERQSAAARCERVQGEMQDLSEAYNNLEVHSYQLEAQIRRLQHPARTDPGLSLLLYRVPSK